MPSPTRKGIFIVLLAMCLVVAVAVVPDIISGKLSEWCLRMFGEGYEGYLLGFFVVGSVVLLFLTTDIAQHMRPGAGPSKPDRYNIPPGAATRKQINLAKTAISEAEPEQALRCLSELKVQALDTEIDLLSSRLVEYQRTKRHGVDAPDEESRVFNRITRDIRDLVSTLEKELAEGDTNYQTIKDYLKKRYTNRLEQKLANRQPVNLRRLVNTDVVPESIKPAFVAYNSEEISGELLQTFRDARGRMLLVGAPGAGKTTLMLQLVLELLNAEPDALPVLINLATWSKEFITLEAWLKKILPAETGASDPYAAKLIQQNRLILLFDGFDEIRQEDRLSCLEAINRYGEDAERLYAISSRKQEFKEVNKAVLVGLPIEVCPLTLEQMKSELQRLWSNPEKPERGAKLLLDAIEKEDLLQKTVQTPFYFNILQILFNGGMTLPELQLTANTLEGHQAEVLERFIEYETKAPFKEDYSPEKIKHWLSFLASRMTQRNMVLFELRDLQYDWWRWTKGQLVKANMVGGLVFGLVFGLVGGLVVGMVSLLVSQMILGLEGGLVVGMVSLLIGGLIGVLIVGLVFGLIGGLTSGLVRVLKDSTYVLQIASPYHRFNASMKALHFSILQHKFLCYQLRKQGLLPPDLVVFLNELSLRHLLEFDGDPTTGKGGGAWRFRHRLLQDYFTAKYFADNAANGTLEELVEKHLHDDTWKEIFLLVADILPQADDMLILMLNKNRELLHDSFLNSLIDVTSKKLLPVKSRYSAEGRKTIVIFAMLAFARTNGLIRKHAHIRNLNTTLGHARTLALALAYEPAVELIQQYAIDTTLALNIDSALSLDPGLAIDHIIYPGNGLALIQALMEGNKLDVQTIDTIQNFLKGNVLLVHCLNSSNNLIQATRDHVLDQLLVPLDEPENQAQPYTT